MRPEHLESVRRWAIFVKENPDKWKKIHTRFINAQFDKHAKFIKRLLKTPDGRDKIVRLYGIKNRNGFRKLLSD